MRTSIVIRFKLTPINPELSQHTMTQDMIVIVRYIPSACLYTNIRLGYFLCRDALSRVRGEASLNEYDLLGILSLIY